MDIIAQVKREETFTFTPNDGTEPVHIRSGALREWLHANAKDKLINLTFPADDTEVTLIERHGLEADRMASMNIIEAADPVIVGLWSDGTHILIDGAHRRWFWHKRGINVLRGWAVPEEVWRSFVFDPDSPFIVRHSPDGSLLPQRSRPSL